MMTSTDFIIATSIALRTQS